MFIFRLICCSIFLSAFLQAGAQSFTLTSAQPEIRIGKGVEYFEDLSGMMDRQQVPADSFKSYLHEQINFGLRSSAVWLRFRLKNLDIAENVILQVGYPLLDEVELHFRSRDSVFSHATGDFYPVASRQIANPYYAFYLPLKPGEEAEVYLRIKTLSSMQVPLRIYSATAFYRSTQVVNIWYGIYYGFLVVMILYNLVIFNSLKDIRYIFYSASIFFSLAFFMILHGYAAFWIWPDSIRWNQISVHVAMGMLTATSALFAYSFLELRKYAPRFRYVVIAVSGAGLLVAACTSIIPVYLLTRLSTYIIMANTLVLTVAGFIAWRSGNRYARLFVAAWICYLLGALLLIGRNLGLLPANMITNNFANIGSAMEVVLLSLALADKVRILRLDKELSDQRMLQLQRDVNEYLESKVEQRTAELKEERDKSEQLLLNILPNTVAEELKEKGMARAKMHQEVSVMFTDFVNFTQICERLSPEALVNQLDRCFRIFDTITYDFGLEKIKTIGDAYLCACGVPKSNPQHAEMTAMAARRILQEMQGFNKDNEAAGLPRFDLRIGIHSGPLISGVVGTRKFAYDIWGDTVNIAARMEQHSQAGRINVSHATYMLLKDHFQFTPRGAVAIKNKGSVNMYFLEDTVS